MVRAGIGPNTVRVELDGLVRVSKGKPPTDYLGKWPVVEVVPIRIIRIVKMGK